MKKVLFVFALVALLGSMANKSFAQLSDEEYNYVTMDLRGILNLTMTTNPQVDFVFKTIQEYKQGITQFNATQLEVDATLSWDLFVYATTDNWTLVEPYSTNGNSYLPAEVLQIQSSFDNTGITGDGVGNAFESLKGITNSAYTTAAGPDATATQFLAGEVGTAAGQQAAPGTAASNPGTHKFRIDMQMKPGVPAIFPNSSVLLTANGNGDAYARAGYYYLEVVYTLVEDL